MNFSEAFTRGGLEASRPAVFQESLTKIVVTGQALHQARYNGRSKGRLHQASRSIQGKSPFDTQADLPGPPNRCKDAGPKGSTHSRAFWVIMDTVSPEQFDKLTAGVNRLAQAIEDASSLLSKLGLGEQPRYNSDGSEDSNPVDEATMAKKLDIPKRTLGQYRRDGRFPNCWVKNGRSVRWRVAETLEVWKRGIS